MSGIELKNSESKKRKQNFKLLACLLCSNLLLLLLFSFFGNESEAKTSSNENLQIFHPGHERLKLNLIPHIAYSNQDKEIPISIYSKAKKLIIARAYLHLNSNEETSSDLKNENNEQSFLVEIPNDQLTKLIDHQDESLSAYPVASIQKIASPAVSQGESYEISF